MPSIIIVMLLQGWTDAHKPKECWVLWQWSVTTVKAMYTNLQAFSLQGRLKRRESLGPYSLEFALLDLIWHDTRIVSQDCDSSTDTNMQRFKTCQRQVKEHKAYIWAIFELCECRVLKCNTAVPCFTEENYSTVFHSLVQIHYGRLRS